VPTAGIRAKISLMAARAATAVRSATLHLGGRLRRLRRDRGLTLAAVSRSCGLSVTHLALVERELRMPPRPSHPAYARLAEVLGVSALALRRAAVRERFVLVEGVPWRRHRMSL
jgi:transcriptional regulator with XRE-family HTH domain